jgi:hypothetical protein
MLTEKDVRNYTELARARVGGLDLALLYSALEKSGFDSGGYIATHPNACDDGFSSANALLYFACFGVDEGWRLTTGAFPKGLGELFGLDIGDLCYKNRVIDKIFTAQVAKSRIERTLWTGKIDPILAKLAQAGAAPFFVIGDSHTSLYQRTVTYADRWLAPLIMTCNAGSAGGLGNADSRSQYGNRLLAWARAVTMRKAPFDLPVLMKFGQVDAEFGWIFDRIRRGQITFDPSDFQGFAAASVRHYMVFLEQFAALIDPALLRICTIFPPSLSDEAWEEGYVNANIGHLEGDRELDDLRGAVRKLDIPDLATRTGMHAVYNDLLRTACKDAGLVVVDDFHPFVDTDTGFLDLSYIAISKGGDHHMDYASTDDAIMQVLKTLFPDV